jgi:hypothetical protein
MNEQEDKDALPKAIFALEFDPNTGIVSGSLDPRFPAKELVYGLTTAVFRTLFNQAMMAAQQEAQKQASQQQNRIVGLDGRPMH